LVASAFGTLAVADVLTKHTLHTVYTVNSYNNAIL
jgi:hypothetical protein